MLAVALAGCGPRDYERRDVAIPMRDGVTLHTIILIPKAVRGAAILLNRTPFGAERRLRLSERSLNDVVPPVYRDAALEHYIFVFQDIRGRSGSGGAREVQRAPIGAFNRTGTDESTDAWDTIDWLTKHVPESNGRVGIIGISYDGFTSLMAALRPHPALKAVVAINPMVNGWKGDDWFENGAFRQVMMSFIFYESGLDADTSWPSVDGDDYQSLLTAGSAGAFAARAGLGRSPYWHTLKAHPAYDAFWRAQALDELLAHDQNTVPTLFVGSLWDQEDIFGAVHAFEASQSRASDLSFLALGPWFHGQVNEDGSTTGPLRWNGDTSAYFRSAILQPFLDQQLLGRAAKHPLARVTAFETGTGIWKQYRSWPQSCASGCPDQPTRIYLSAGGKLSLGPSNGQAWDRYVSDPSRPVPFSNHVSTVVTEVGEGWKSWLLEDQRPFARRPDVLTYVSDPLQQPLRIAGEPVADLFASTTGTDSDWVVKLIDVYPADRRIAGSMAGYELPIGMAIFRGRYAKDPANAQPIEPGKVGRYKFALPTANHVFEPGHRIMVQVQSSWFPLYDRNPQQFVHNIFDARASDYRTAAQRIYHSAGTASALELPTAGN